jgi:hypothetical protein
MKRRTIIMKHNKMGSLHPIPAFVLKPQSALSKRITWFSYDGAPTAVKLQLLEKQDYGHE